MKITAISDMHGCFPKLPSGDILIIAGDCTLSNQTLEWKDFFQWFKVQDYRKKIIVGGNHDNFLAQCITTQEYFEMFGEGIREEEDFYEYLWDNGCEFEGLKIWGSPWNLHFEGINPYCTAFTGNEDKLKEKFSKIPNNIDILITHSPPWGILDLSNRGEHCGSASLRFQYERLNIKHHIFGHIHESHGQMNYKRMLDDRPDIQCYNVSIMDGKFKPSNRPTNFEI